MKHAVTRRPRYGRVWVAVLLLILGVAAIASTVRTDTWWYGTTGFLCLLFVPGLIFDAAVDEVLRRIDRERSDS